MIRIHSCGLLLVALAFAPTAMAQTSGSARLRLEVRPTILAMHGDTVRVSYVVRNRPEGADTLFGFTVDAPGIISVDLPGPKAGWATSIRFRRRHVASWGMLGDHLEPGRATPPLTYGAIGLPDIVRYWADRYTDYIPPDSLYDRQPGPSDDSVTADGGIGFTVGVGPLPADRSPGALANRAHG